MQQKEGSSKQELRLGDDIKRSLDYKRTDQEFQVIGTVLCCFSQLVFSQSNPRNQEQGLKTVSKKAFI